MHFQVLPCLSDQELIYPVVPVTRTAWERSRQGTSVSLWAKQLSNTHRLRDNKLWEGESSWSLNVLWFSAIKVLFSCTQKGEKRKKKRHILRALWPKLDLNIFPSFSRATLNACSDKTQSQSQQYALSASAPAALLWSLRHTSNNKNYQHFLTDTLDALLRSDISIVFW